MATCIDSTRTVLIGFSILGLLVVGSACAQSGREANAGPPQARSGAESSPKLHDALLKRTRETSDPVKAWVIFRDKGLESLDSQQEALAELAASYDARAVQRRSTRGTMLKRDGRVFDALDLAVSQSYVDAVAATGARVCGTSRWLNAASVWADRRQLEQIAALPFVERLKPVARARPPKPIYVRELGPAAAGDGARGRLDYGLASGQLSQISLIGLHERGFAGGGMIIGVLDTGFRVDHKAFNHPDYPLTVIAAYDFINNDSNVGPEPGDPSSQHNHGTWILGTLAAYQPGELIGAAYGASYILCKTEDTADEYPAEEDYYVFGLEFIEANGGDVATSSLSYLDWYSQSDLDGHTAVTTIAVNAATARGLLCCTAASNNGHDGNPATSHLGAPADALEVITCGAVGVDGGIADFSSDGPTADGRVKPELLALGLYTATVSAGGSEGYAAVSGTSLSTPLIAGAVACLAQARPLWSPAELRDRMFRTAEGYFADGATDPLFIRGYGLLNAEAVLADCDQNGTPDRIDIQNGLHEDCTWNGIPDQCEPDCNGNGVADSCDIAADPAIDCQRNGIPDSCDLAADPSADCDGNGRLDVCDLAPAQSAKLLAGTPGYQDRFGFAVALWVDTAVIGAYQEDAQGARSGAAYVFRHDGRGWVQQARLVPSDGAAADYFGHSVAIQGDTIVVGAYGDDDNGPVSGSAYVFREIDGVWAQEAKLTAADGAEDDRFGSAIAVWGRLVLVGAHKNDDNGASSGSAYLFVRDSHGWTELDKLLPADGSAGDVFGRAVALSHGRAVIGAYQNDERGANAGAAYVFVPTAKGWTQQAKLCPPELAAGDYFGCSVAVWGKTVLCGAFRDDDRGLDAGAAYVFRHDGGSWVEAGKLTAADAGAGDNLGQSVALWGRHALCGAHGEDELGTGAGAAYLFSFDGAQWQQRARLLADDGSANDSFGYAVALCGETALSGAHLAEHEGSSCGATYAFALTPHDCNGNGFPDSCDVASGASPDEDGDGVPDECQPALGDMNCDGAVDTDDVDPFVWALVNPALYQQMHPLCDRLSADCNLDDRVDFGDINAFVMLLIR